LSKFSSRVNQCLGIIRGLELFQRYNPNPDYSLLSGARGLPYPQMWVYYLNNAMYDYLMADWSLLQFEEREPERGEPKYRYSYVQCPHQPALSFEKYSQESKTAARQDLEDEYFGHLTEEGEEREHPRLIRYDYTPAQYRAGCHPASHMHIGCDDEFRVGTRKRMAPLSFVLFVARHSYTDNWTKYFCDDEDAKIDNSQNRKKYDKFVRENLTSVAMKYFTHADEMEMHLF